MVSSAHQQVFRILSIAAASSCALIGLVVLVGWSAGIESLIQIRPNYPAMNPTTAICFVMIGLALAISSARPDRTASRRIAACLAGGTALIGAARVMESFFSMELHVDRLLYATTLSDPSHIHTRMAPSTAALFLAFGVAIPCAVSRHRGSLPIARVLAIMSILFTAFMISGYALGVQEKLGITNVNPMALHTAAAFFLIGAGILGAMQSAAGALMPRSLLGKGKSWILFDGRLEQNIATGFIASLFLLSLVGVASYISMQRTMQDRWSNRLSRMILVDLLQLESAIKDIETSQRGFVLTQNESFLEPYAAGRVEAENLINSLRELTQDDPMLSARLEKVAVATQDRMEFAEYVIHVDREQGPQAAAQLIQAGTGMQLMDEILATIDDMTDATMKLVDQRTKRTASTENITMAVISFGTLAGIAIVFAASFIIRRDITVKREAESLLRSSETQFRYLADAMSQFVWILDPMGNLTYANARWAEFVGAPREQLTDDEWKSSLCWKDLPFFLEHWNNAISNARPLEGEYRLARSRDDTPRWHLCRGEPQLDEAGRIVRWIFTWTDIDQHKQIEASLQEAKGAAESASDAKSQFLARMSHEIRTPLNGIIGMLDLLIGADLNPRQQRYSLMAKSSAEALTALINDILDFSKIEAGKMELSSAEFSLANSVETVAEMIATRASKKKVEIGVFVDPRVPDQVRGDPDRLRQILINLMGNSVKFTESGSITLEVEYVGRSDDHIRIRFAVTDTGIGISAAGTEHLFKTFSQVDVSTTRHYGGTGLGLAICKQLVELMHGEIGVESEMGKGSRFWFEIPLQVVEQAEPSAATTPDARGLRVLAVEGEPGARSILERQLTSLSMIVQLAATGAETIPILENARAACAPIEVALIDEDLPDMDGSELAATIKAREDLSDTVLMIMVSVNDSPDPESLRKLGFHGHLTKPIRQSQLFDAIISALHAARGSPGRLPVPKSLSTERPTPRKQNILVVEDNEVNLIVATEILTRAGYSSGTARNGREAVEAFKSGDYDLILMDCQMPYMDGFEATRTIRDLESMDGNAPGERRHIPIIALTANAVRGDRERCIEAGMDDYVTKPLQPEALIAAIDKAAEALTVPKASVEAPADSDGVAVSNAMSPQKHSIDAPAIDMVAVARDWPDNRRFQHDLLRKFIEKGREDMSQIADRMESGDAPEIERLVHGLKGAAGCIHAERVRQAASKLEGLVHTRSMTSAGTILAELQREFHRCLEQYERENASKPHEELQGSRSGEKQCVF